MNGPANTKRLLRRALLRMGGALVVLLGVFLATAGTLAYWQAWLYVAVMLGLVSALLVYLLRHDPGLLERRMRTREKEAPQRLIVGLGALGYALVFLLPGFDRRFGWSHLPAWGAILADTLIAVAYLLFYRVMRVNSYASRVVEVEPGQRVVTTGPYAVVRHPMYVAAILIFVASPLALGSLWGALASLPLIGVMVLRIRNEEEVLLRDLEGYAAYMRATRYRLIPGVW